MRYIAIDHGMRRTGLAICDPGEQIVCPLEVINDPKNVVEKAAEIIRREQPDAIIIGLPLNMDGSSGGQARIVTEFAKQLEAVIDLPIIFQDERLTSYGAKNKLAEIDLSRRKKKKKLDAIAAAHILQDFIDNKTPPPQYNPDPEDSDPDSPDDPY